MKNSFFYSPPYTDRQAEDVLRRRQRERVQDHIPAQLRALRELQLDLLPGPQRDGPPRAVELDHFLHRLLGGRKPPKPVRDLTKGTNEK